MSKRVFRVLVLISVAASLANLSLVLYLPPERIFPEFAPLMARYYEPLVFTDWIEFSIFLSVLVLILAGYLIVVAGLCRFYRWARNIYTIFILIALLLYVFAMLTEPAPVLYSQYEELLFWLSSLLDGFLLCAMWLTPLAGQFRSVRKEAL